MGKKIVLPVVTAEPCIIDQRPVTHPDIGEEVTG